MTDIIMCQKIYGQRERGGEKSTFSCTSFVFKLLSLVLSTCLSEMLELLETEQYTHSALMKAL